MKISKVIFSSNIKINDLYKDGLQREQFIPFIKVMKKKCFEQMLSIKEDYRKSKNKNNDRYLYPLNEITNFKINKLFRKLTRGKAKQKKFYQLKVENLISRIIMKVLLGLILMNYAIRILEQKTTLKSLTLVNTS